MVLTDRATQCLTSFSLDFERRSANTSAGPDMTVNSVTVNGRPARFKFVQRTYPGDPAGHDPAPAAHEASESNPVGGPFNNPLPPACSPELPDTNATADSMDGTPCPASKLVITPSSPVPDSALFNVAVSYTGRPGVHNDGDGTTEGWFRAPRLSQFFAQWFDTAYPSGGGANRPMITGPGLAGPGFYSAPGVCG